MTHSFLSLPIDLLAIVGTLAGKDGYQRLSQVCKATRRLTQDPYKKTAQAAFYTQQPKVLVVTAEDATIIISCPECRQCVDVSIYDTYASRLIECYCVTDDYPKDGWKHDSFLVPCCSMSVTDPFSPPKTLSLIEARKRYERLDTTLSQWMGDLSTLTCVEVPVATINKVTDSMMFYCLASDRQLSRVKLTDFYSHYFYPNFYVLEKKLDSLMERFGIYPRTANDTDWEKSWHTAWVVESPYLLKPMAPYPKNCGWETYQLGDDDMNIVGLCTGFKGRKFCFELDTDVW
jgi:hypothetical protein